MVDGNVDEDNEEDAISRFDFNNMHKNHNNVSLHISRMKNSCF